MNPFARGEFSRKRERKRLGGAALPAVVLAAVIACAVFAPWIAPHKPRVGNLGEKLLPPFWIEGGVSSHILGTDDLGRDILSRVIYGARVSLTVAFLAVFFAGTLGTFTGLVAGYFGGLVDALCMRLADITLAIPMILLAIILVAALGVSFVNVIVVVVLLLWPYYARQVRGETLSIRQRDFVALARVAGCSNSRIILKYILPNVMPSLLVLLTLQSAYVILLESALSFLGVGVPPPTPAWGLMVGEGRMYIVSAWWLSFWPGLTILFTVLSINLLGDWLRDRFDPKLKQV